MMSTNYSRATLLAVSALALTLPACAGKSVKGDTTYIARDVNTLYGLAKEALDRKEYALSAKLFDEVERQHPYSVWSRRAQLMSAFSYYMAQKYPEAVSSAQRFITIHPGNKDAPYASYLIAMSYYQQIEDVGRDQKITQQATDAFDEGSDQRPSRRQGNGSRTLLPALGQMACRGDPVPRRDRQISDHQPHARGARAAGRDLFQPRHAGRGAQGRGGAGQELPGQRMV
jgi:outer membrane protein assembly factor BamD